MKNLNSFDSEENLEINKRIYKYFDLKTVANQFNVNLLNVPISIKIILENLIRNEDGESINKDMITSVFQSINNNNKTQEIAFFPTRVLMQDFTGVPAVADLAAMRDAVSEKGKDPSKVNPMSQVDLVIDHSVMVDYFASPKAFQKNVDMEFGRNIERYEFLKWGQQAFKNFRVIPPGTGICHQVNLEYLAEVVWSSKQNEKNYLYPDTLVGTDSHTTIDRKSVV